MPLIMIYMIVSEKPLIDTNLYTYAGSNPVSRSDPSGLLNIIGGGGVSLIAITGVEGSGGVVVNTAGGLSNIGLTGSFGIGGGLNVSGDIYGGIITGDIGNVSGETINVNGVLGPISLTFFTDMNGNVVGGTIGYGPGIPVGGSLTYSNTGVLTLQKILDFIRGKREVKLAPCH